jgi:hypothetical protein
MPQEITDRPDLQALEELLRLRAHARERGHRKIE